MKLMGIDNKNILYIGASGGIGQSLIPLLEEKYTVVGHYHNNKPTHPDILYQSDITDYKQVKSMIDEIIKKYKKIDILINSSAKSYNSFLHKSDSNLWKEVINVNCLGVYNVIREVIPYMRENNYGRIINFSSVVSHKPQYGTSAYASSKSFLDAFTKAISLENSLKGITCNNLTIGYSEVGLIQTVKEDILKDIMSSIPKNRLCTIPEIFNAVEFIINTDYFTGHSIELDGGMI